MSHPKQIIVHVNREKVAFDRPEQTGRSIKARAGIPNDHILCVEAREHCGCEGSKREDELVVVGDDEIFHLEDGQRFRTILPAGCSVVVTINAKPYEFSDPHQTGRTLKERAGIPNTDVLFRDRPGEDEVIPDDAKIVLKCDDRFHSAPPANYGNTPAISPSDVGSDRFETLAQPDGWTFLVVPDFPLPDAFMPRSTRLLIKLPPLFPDAAPDMFWVSPPVRTVSGGAPQGTSSEQLLGVEWQRFSWHLLPGAWRVGSSTLRDYLRCVRARFEKRN